MTDTTALIITKNEEKNISECINSIKSFAVRILVVDSGSEDNTVEIARGLGAEVYYHKFETHARQRNWAIDNLNVSSKWILRIDADERLTPELICELETLMEKHQDDDVNGVTVGAWLFFLGKKLVFGGSRKKKIILFKTGKGAIEDRKMDEHTILYDGRSIEAKNKFLHYDFKDIDSYVKKLNWYAEREMQDYFETLTGKKDALSDREIKSIRGKKFSIYYKFPIFLRCRLFYYYQLILKGNILNGKEGRLYSFLYHYYYRMLVDAKIYEHEMNSVPFQELKSL